MHLPASRSPRLAINTFIVSLSTRSVSLPPHGTAHPGGAAQREAAKEACEGFHTAKFCAFTVELMKPQNTKALPQGRFVAKAFHGFIRSPFTRRSLSDAEPFHTPPREGLSHTPARRAFTPPRQKGFHTPGRRAFTPPPPEGLSHAEPFHTPTFVKPRRAIRCSPFANTCLRTVNTFFKFHSQIVS